MGIEEPMEDPVAYDGSIEQPMESFAAIDQIGKAWIGFE